MNLVALKTVSCAMTTLDHLSLAQVKELQEALSTLGYGLDVDGILGPMTQGRWARFKADNGLDQPGSIGPNSIALLEHRLSGATTDDVPRQVVSLVKAFEGFRSEAYQDGVGVWTIGFGTTVYPNGNRVQPGEAVTESQALGYLAHDLQGTAKTLAANVPYWNSMNANQRSALISFGYNLGDGFYCASGFSSISSALSDHRWADVPSVLPLYSDPGDQNVHSGLLRRRIAEGDLWQGMGEFASSA